MKKTALFLAFTSLSFCNDPAHAQAGSAEKPPLPSLVNGRNTDGNDPLQEWFPDSGGVLSITYTNDLMNNMSGGNRRGAVDMGMLEAQLTFDLGKFIGLDDWTFFANGFQLHNTGRFRRDYVGAQNTIAWTEARPTTRLSELWFEYKPSDYIGLRLGQLAADTEFSISEVSTLFLQSDWATILASAMPSGGPAAPLSTPGVRLRIESDKNTAFIIALFNGDPAGKGTGDEQTRNRHGLNFRINDSTLLMAEGQYRVNQGDKDLGLASSYKLGVWRHQDDFADQRFAADGRSLADPTSNGIGRPHRGNYGIYSVVDQQIYRPAGVGPDGGLSIFNRISASPSDRNAIDFFIDGGVVVAGMLASRPNDKFGASVIYSRYSGGARGFDRDQNAFSGISGQVRDAETSFEMTYSAQITENWIIQPDAQYIRHPSGQAGRNAKVIGLRTILKY